MNERPHLMVQKGPDAGREIALPCKGARVGRSSKNDVVLGDPGLSRHHCRFFFKDGRLWVADLGSSNNTLVNDRPVMEVRVKTGDVVAIGDSELKVVCDEAPEAPPAGPLSGRQAGPTVDLGLGHATDSTRRKRIGLGPLLVVAALVCAFALAVWLPKVMSGKDSHSTGAWAGDTRPEALEVSYEKVLASAQNIFRYALTITGDRGIAIEIDDVKSDRSVREEGKVKEELIVELAQYLQTSGFFDLAPQYEGVQPDVFEQADITITVDGRTHNCRVLNRVEPDVFKDVRDRLEKFGQVELGLWAMQYSVEKLTEMAQNAFQLARKLYDEREAAYSNLSKAMKSFEEAEFYLKTVEPKPDFYKDMVSAMIVCRDELARKYEDQNFRAQRAMKLKDWETAQRELQILCEIVSDSSDIRHESARKSLLEVETRINLQK